MKKSVQTVRGMQDQLPGQTNAWHFLEKKVAQVFNSYGYVEIRTPMLEHKDLFVQPVGEDSDIVTKELFYCGSKDKLEFCLRPEGTVPTLRALANANLLRGETPRVYYMGPMFRHERPQQGRLRQFHQFGVEFLGEKAAGADCEVIMLCASLWEELNILSTVNLEINNLGQVEERLKYKEELKKYFLSYQSDLSELDIQRLETNPLRILDSKEEAVSKLINDAPKLSNYLSTESKLHFDTVLNQLTKSNIPYKINEYLVRGLDYYNLTVFEWIDTNIDSRQNTIAGGGRYDGLLTKINGDKNSTGVGMAAGMERIITKLAADIQQENIDFYLGMIGDAFDLNIVLTLAQSLRRQGFMVKTSLAKCKIHTLLQNANSSLANYAIVIGKQELANNIVTVKPLQSNQEQFTLALENCANELSAKLAKE